MVQTCIWDFIVHHYYAQTRVHINARARVHTHTHKTTLTRSITEMQHYNTNFLLSMKLGNLSASA